ncbi:hypothetical protein HPB48_018578 [Haemaphysalis longicornis]|uniref:Uncharacterized protein n=1 Tax=Haemaphysalis longicornis TaxID=44386 RepID=A0A9J6FW97_HAELO|nr:hypothetical protein HPB48_018578 [Haemaphysalis longicornis]
MARQYSGKKNWSTAHRERWMECLSLTLEQALNIRNGLTNPELKSLLTNRSLYKDVEERRVCFTCKLCYRTACYMCSIKPHIPTHGFDTIPVYMLCPTGTEQGSRSHSPHSALSQCTSGSAPSLTHPEQSWRCHCEHQAQRGPIVSLAPGSEATV